MGRGLFATGTRGFGGRLVAGIGPPGDPRSERSTLLLTSPVLEVGGLSGCPAVRLESVYYPVYRLLFVEVGSWVACIVVLRLGDVGTSFGLCLVSFF